MKYKLYHICTKGRQSHPLYRDEEDLRQAVNRTAWLAEKHGVIIIAYDHPINHSHFDVLAFCEEDARAFGNSYKQETGLYIYHKYNDRKQYRRIEMTVKEVKSSRYGKICIAYVNGNSFGHGIIQDMSESISSGHRAYITEDSGDCCIRVCDLSRADQLKIFRTKYDFRNSNLIYNVKEGMILPKSFVSAEIGLSYFTGVEEYLAMVADLNTYNEVDYITNVEKWAGRDTVIREQAEKWAVDWFGKASMDLLSDNQKLKLATYLRSKYKSFPAQLANILQFSEEKLDKYLSKRYLDNYDTM